jgi:hypothetical protein
MRVVLVLGCAACAASAPGQPIFTLPVTVGGDVHDLQYFESDTPSSAATAFCGRFGLAHECSMELDTVLSKKRLQFDLQKFLPKGGGKQGGRAHKTVRAGDTASILHNEVTRLRLELVETQVKLREAELLLGSCRAGQQCAAAETDAVEGAGGAGAANEETLPPLEAEPSTTAMATTAPSGEAIADPPRKELFSLDLSWDGSGKSQTFRVWADSADPAADAARFCTEHDCSEHVPLINEATLRHLRGKLCRAHLAPTAPGGAGLYRFAAYFKLRWFRHMIGNALSLYWHHRAVAHFLEATHGEGLLQAVAGGVGPVSEARAVRQVREEAAAMAAAQATAQAAAQAAASQAGEAPEKLVWLDLLHPPTAAMADVRSGGSRMPPSEHASGLASSLTAQHWGWADHGVDCGPAAVVDGAGAGAGSGAGEQRPLRPEELAARVRTAAALLAAARCVRSTRDGIAAHSCVGSWTQPWALARARVESAAAIREIGVSRQGAGAGGVEAEAGADVEAEGILENDGGGLAEAPRPWGAQDTGAGDVAVHFRCGDLLRIADDVYGIPKFEWVARQVLRARRLLLGGGEGEEGSDTGGETASDGASGRVKAGSAPPPLRVRVVGNVRASRSGQPQCDGGTDGDCGIVLQGLLRFLRSRLRCPVRFEGQGPDEDFEALRRAPWMVGSVSTFSLWAAVLAQEPLQAFAAGAMLPRTDLFFEGRLPPPITWPTAGASIDSAAHAALPAPLPAGGVAGQGVGQGQGEGGGERQLLWAEVPEGSIISSRHLSGMDGREAAAALALATSFD